MTIGSLVGASIVALSFAGSWLGAWSGMTNTRPRFAIVKFNFCRLAARY